MFERLYFASQATPTSPLLNPDTGGTTGQSAPATPQAPTTPVSTPSPTPIVSSSAPATPSTPVEAGGLGGSSVSTPPSHRQWASQALGFDFTRYADDNAAADAIRSVMQQAQQWRQDSQRFNQEVAPNWTQFQEFLKTRQAPAQPQAQTKDWWGAPEYDPRWEQALEPDGQGGYRVKPGFAPDTLHKFTQYQQFQKEAVQKLLRNPIETLKPGIEQLVQPLIQQAIQQSMGGYQQHQVGQQIVQQHSSWIYSPTPNPVTGARDFTPAGAYYVKQIQRLDAMGVKDPQAAHEIAMGQTKAALFEQMYSSQLHGQQQVTPQQQPVGILPNGTPGPVNRIAQYASNGVQNTDRTQQPNAPQSLQALLKQAFAEAGLNDQMLAAQMSRLPGS